MARVLVLLPTILRCPLKVFGGEHTGPVQALAALPEGRLVGVGKDRTIGILDLYTGEHQVLTEKYTGLVSGGRDGTVRLWNLDMGEHQALRKNPARLIQES